MDQRGYLEAAAQRFTEFGGFVTVEEEALPPLMAEWAELVVERVEPGLTTLVAFVPLQTGSLLTVVKDAMAAHLAESIQGSRSEGVGLILLLTEERINRAGYDRIQQLVERRGRVRIVPWVVDLERGALFGHEGPPFGIDPDLYMLADPAAERKAPAAAEVLRPHRRMGLPWLTVGLAAILVAIWVAMTLTGGSIRATEDTELLYRWGAALRPDLIQDQEYWRLVTAGFLHIGVAHLFMNTLSLWWVGGLVERLYGPLRMGFIYLVALVVGSAISLMFGPPIILSAGASGAIFGLLGAILWYRLKAPNRERLEQVPILLVVLLSLFGGVIAYENVDNWGHFGGLVGGLIAAAAVGFPGAGQPRGRKMLHGVATLALLVLSAAAVLGAVPLPGDSRRLADSLTSWEEGRYQAAEQGMVLVRDAHPDDHRLYLLLAWFYYDQGRFDEAGSQLERVFALDPGNAGAKELLKRLPPPARP